MTSPFPPERTLRVARASFLAPAPLAFPFESRATVLISRRSLHRRRIPHPPASVRGADAAGARSARRRRGRPRRDIQLVFRLLLRDKFLSPELRRLSHATTILSSSAISLIAIAVVSSRDQSHSAR